VPRNVARASFLHHFASVLFLPLFFSCLSFLCESIYIFFTTASPFRPTAPGRFLLPSTRDAFRSAGLPLPLFLILGLFSYFFFPSHDRRISFLYPLAPFPKFNWSRSLRPSCGGRRESIDLPPPFYRHLQGQRCSLPSSFSRIFPVPPPLRSSMFLKLSFDPPHYLPSAFGSIVIERTVCSSTPLRATSLGGWLVLSFPPHVPSSPYY